VDRVFIDRLRWYKTLTTRSAAECPATIYGPLCGRASYRTVRVSLCLYRSNMQLRTYIRFEITQSRVLLYGCFGQNPHLHYYNYCHHPSPWTSFVTHRTSSIRNFGESLTFLSENRDFICMWGRIFSPNLSFLYASVLHLCAWMGRTNGRTDGRTDVRTDSTTE